MNSCGPDATRPYATQLPRNYFAAPLGAEGEVGPGLVGAAPVVEDGFCFGRLGALAVGGMFTPLPAGLLFEANTNSRTADEHGGSDPPPDGVDVTGGAVEFGPSIVARVAQARV